MRIGDVVVPRTNEIGKFLHCGTGRYSHAIIGSLDPFVLVSDDGSMVWSCTCEPNEVVSLCQASEAIQKIVQDRLALTKEHVTQEGE